MTQPFGHPPAHFQYWPGPPPVPVSPGGVPLADVGTRLLAYIIDRALIGGALMVIGTPVLLVVMFRSMFNPVIVAGDDYAMAVPFPMFWPLLLAEFGLVLLGLVLSYCYAVEYMHRSGQTLGKKVMKIRVVPLDPGLRLTRGMAARRFLVEFVVGGLVPFFSLADGLWLLGDRPFQQTLHDKAAETVVVKVSP